MVGSGVDFMNVFVGLYEFIVFDMNGDEVFGLFNVIFEDGISVSNVVLILFICSNSDGVIQVLVVGGFGVYDFIWSIGQMDVYSIFNLLVGSYSFIVMDVNIGCDFVIGIVFEDEELIISYVYECIIMLDGSMIVDIFCVVWLDG